MHKLDGDKITIGYDFVFPNFVVPNALQTDITIVNYLLLLIQFLSVLHLLHQMIEVALILKFVEIFIGMWEPDDRLILVMFDN